MHHIEDPRQSSFYDPFEHLLSPLARKTIEEGWQGVFRHVILEVLPVDVLAGEFSETMGRPTKELYSMAGLIFIMEFNDWTVEQAANAYMFDVPMMPSFSDLEQNRIKEMEEFVEREVADSSVKIQKSIRHGRPFVEIIQTARDEDVNLIVIATHGRGGLEHVLFGSTAEKVVRKAPCPVLSIRMPGYEFQMP